MVNYVFQQWKEILPEHLSSYQSVYLANLDGTTDFVTKEYSKKLSFTVTMMKLTQKCLLILSFFQTQFS